MTRKHTLTLLVLALVVAAITAPAAMARPIDAVGLPYTQGDTPASVSPSVSSSQSGSDNPGSGFDWGDAGIGAAAAFAITTIGVGGALLLSNRRQRNDRQAATA
jgi:hypothetical protein